MAKKNDTENIIGCILAPFMLPLLSILHGYVLSVMWKWFFVPTFHVNPIGIPAAIGCALTIAMITHKSDLGDKPAKDYREEVSTLTHLFAPICADVMVLGIAFIVKQFM